MCSEGWGKAVIGHIESVLNMKISIHPNGKDL